MLQRLPTALAQLKACNNSENLLKEIRHIVYSFYHSKQITRKVYKYTKYTITLLSQYKGGHYIY